MFRLTRWYEGRTAEQELWKWLKRAEREGRGVGGDVSKCRPHGWRMPAIGDTHLECTICDRKMSYTAEMTTDKYVSIVNA